MTIKMQPKALKEKPQKAGQKTPSKELLKAIAELKDMEKNPHLYKGYTNAKDMIKACLDE